MTKESGRKDESSAEKQPDNKHKRRMIIGIVCGALLVAAAVLIVLLTGGEDIAGQWASEKDGVAVTFDENGSAVMHRLGDRQTVAYMYDKRGGKGSLDVDDGVRFTVSMGQMTMELRGKTVALERTGGQTDIDAMMVAQMDGVWTSERRGRVMVMRGGKAQMHSVGSDMQGSLIYDTVSGEAVLTLGDEQIAFDAHKTTLNLGDTGLFLRADDDLDIAAYVAAYASRLAGIWYDTEGRLGSIELTEDGSMAAVRYGHTVGGTYTFDEAAGQGVLADDEMDSEVGFALSNGVLTFADAVFTKKQVAQLGAENIYDAVAGLWHDATATGDTITFFHDGTLTMSADGTDVAVVYNYNPVHAFGAAQLGTGDGAVLAEFFLMGDTLYFGEREYVREVGIGGGDILGWWFDTLNEYGAFSFAGDGSVDVALHGVSETGKGTYTVDAQTGRGQIAFEAGGSAFEGPIYVTQDRLYIDGIGFDRDGSDAVLGTWYHYAGHLGTLTFLEDGTLETVIHGTTEQGTYTYDAVTRDGTVTVDGMAHELVYELGWLEVGGELYTRSFVEQTE